VRSQTSKSPKSKVQSGTRHRRRTWNTTKRQSRKSSVHATVVKSKVKSSTWNTAKATNMKHNKETVEKEQDSCDGCASTCAMYNVQCAMYNVYASPYHRTVAHGHHCTLHHFYPLHQQLQHHMVVVLAPFPSRTATFAFPGFLLLQPLFRHSFKHLHIVEEKHHVTKKQRHQSTPKKKQRVPSVKMYRTVENTQ
jgi:hypothetical protein